MRGTLCNWAGNYTYQAERVHQPGTLEEIQRLVAGTKKVRALGSRHSFNAIADCTEDLISLERFNRVIALDAERRQVRVEAGVKYGQVGEYLHARGFALSNFASLPHISVAGAVATATHGSGDENGNLATAVAAIELVNGAGERVRFSREMDGERFAGMVVALGALGIVTELTLDVVPAFTVRQNVYENVPFSEAERHFDAIMASGYSVSLFTNWTGRRFSQVWIKRAGENVPALPATFFGATPAPADRHPITGISAENCTPQMGVPGPAHERLPHFRMNFTPSSGVELQSEYFVPREHAVAALRELFSLHERISPLLLISEVRTIAEDDLWLSPCYKRACAAIHFTWKQDWEAVGRVLPFIEERLAPFEARPHWGKLFCVSPARVKQYYDRMENFRRLAGMVDPGEKFRNVFVSRFVDADAWRRA